MVKVAQARNKAGNLVLYKTESYKFLKRRMSSRTIAFMGLAVATTLGLASFMTSNASALTGARTISFFNTHTKQNLTITYKRYGQYIPAAMRKLNYILRDWRTDQVVRMDPKLIDLLWEIHTGLGSRKPIHILSGYRSPKTNAMLRRRSRAVSRYSRHMFGMASDVRFPDISVKKLRNFAMLKQRGGVGYYRGSFVHVDVGSVRHWPRMSKQQLAKLFPNGRSLHVPRGVARPLGGRVAARSLPRATVYSRAPAGVVRGSPPNRIKAPSRVQIASLKTKPARKRPVIRTLANVPVPRARPAVAIAAAPVFNGPVPLPRANPVVQSRLAALKVPEIPEVVIASASSFSFSRATTPVREVAIARPVQNPVEVITARSVQKTKPKRGLFGFASLAPRVSSRVKTNRRSLASSLVNVNRTLKGDRLITHAAMEQIGARTKIASRMDAPIITAASHTYPYKVEQERKKKSSSFGLLSALFPMFSGSGNN